MIVWFVACWFIGASRGQVDLEPFFALAYPDATEVVRVSDTVLRAEGPDGLVLGYVAVTSASGYGGPLSLVVAVDPEGTVASPGCWPFNAGHPAGPLPSPLGE